MLVHVCTEASGVAVSKWYRRACIGGCAISACGHPQAYVAGDFVGNNMRVKIAVKKILGRTNKIASTL